MTDQPDTAGEMTRFERALLEAIRASPPHVGAHAVLYLVSTQRCEHGLRGDRCWRCLTRGAGTA